MTVSTGLQRAEGASAEHYALCRCGQSRNKPFCSGMHWYAGFRDPVPDAAREPTPFEWAGGLPGLTRMTRLLYAKHVPADPLLAEVFAGMPADQPQRLAAWLAAALGGRRRRPGRLRRAGRTATPGTSAGRSAHAATGSVSSTGPGGCRCSAPPPTTRRCPPTQPSGPCCPPAPTGCPGPRSRRHSRALPRLHRRPEPPGLRCHAGAGDPGGPPVTDRAGGPEPQAAAEPELPGPDEPVSFAAHIRPLFRDGTGSR